MSRRSRMREMDERPRVRPARRRCDRRNRVRRRVYPRQAPALIPTALRDHRRHLQLLRLHHLGAVRNLRVLRRRVLARDRVLGVQGRPPARRRSVARRHGALLGLVPPFVGPIIYLFLRPPDSIEERRDRELENRALEERLAERDLRCPVCRGQVDASYLVCPVCTTRLKQACTECGAPLEPIWQACPYCARPCRRRPHRRRALQPLRSRRRTT